MPEALYGAGTTTNMRKYSAPVIWSLALVILYLPFNSDVSLCLFRWVGFNSCFGCGIGRSIHHALHLQWAASIEAHWLGIPATLGILYSIIYSFSQTKPITAHGPTANAPDVA